MVLQNETLTVVSTSGTDTMVIAFAGDAPQTVALNGTTPVTTTGAHFKLLMAVSLAMPAAGTITVTGSVTGLLLTINPGEVVLPLEPVQPKTTTTRDMPRDLVGKPGYEFVHGSLADYGYTERGVADTNEQPIAPGTPHPQNSRLLLVGQKLTDGEDNKRLRVRVYASVVKADDQKKYGYTVSYSDEAKLFPKIGWRIRVKAADYPDMCWSQACLVPGYTAIGGLTLTHEDFTPEDDGVFGAVNLAYERIAGPELEGEEGITTNRLLMRHVTDTTKVTVKQTPVAPGTAAPKGFLITASIVTPLNALTSMQETSTVEAFDILTTRARSPKADGLETITTEEIVPPGTEPLPWMYGRLEARVESIGALRSIRTTETLVPAGAMIGDAINIAGMASQDPSTGTATIVETETAHGFVTGDSVVIDGVGDADTSPPVNGAFVVTNLDATHFSIPVLMREAGTGGTVQKQALEFPELTDPAEVDRESLAVVVTTRQKVPKGSVLPLAVVYKGSSAGMTVAVASGSVTTYSISNSGTGYGPVVGLRFAAPGTGRTAQGYALAPGGSILQVVITDAGTGYSSAPAVTVLDTTLVTVEQRDIDIAHAWRIVTVEASSPYNSEAYALVEYKSENREFPGRLDAQLVNLFGAQAGYQEPTAQNAPVTVKTYWVIQDGTPALDLDEVIPQTVWINGKAYRGVLHDGFTASAVQGSNSTIVYYPATTPTLTEYLGTQVLLDGAITLTEGSTAVSGSGTAFLTQLPDGSEINGIPEAKTTGTPSSDTAATLAEAWPNPTMTISSGQAYLFGVGGWYGQLRNIAGSVTSDRWKKSWRVQKLFVEMR